MEVKIKSLVGPEDPPFKMPVRGTEHAACWDVYANQIVQTGPGKVTVHLGFAMEIPEGYAVELVPRSGITKTQFVQNNSPGQIDSDYRGPMQMRFTGIPVLQEVETEAGKGLEISYGEFPYKVGERCGQMYLRPVIPMELVKVDELSDTARGEGGFGSTGKS